jgi:putative oxidoreductase
MASVVVQSNAVKIGVWVLRVLLAAAFLLAAGMKLSGQAITVTEFDEVGLGQWFRYFTGTLELIGGVAVLVPPVSIFGAMLLLLVDFGALVAQLTILHRDWIHVIVIGVLLGLLIYIQRSRLTT